MVRLLSRKLKRRLMKRRKKKSNLRSIRKKDWKDAKLTKGKFTWAGRSITRTWRTSKSQTKTRKMLLKSWRKFTTKLTSLTYTWLEPFQSYLRNQSTKIRWWMWITTITFFLTPFWKREPKLMERVNKIQTRTFLLAALESQRGWRVRSLLKEAIWARDLLEINLSKSNSRKLIEEREEDNWVTIWINPILVITLLEVRAALHLQVLEKKQGL